MARVTAIVKGRKLAKGDRWRSWNLLKVPVKIAIEIAGKLYEQKKIKVRDQKSPRLKKR